MALVAVGAAVAGGWWLLHSRLLSAKVVTVVGSVHTPAAEIEAVAGVSGHPPLLDVDSGAAEARLEQLPWVRSATVARQWPDGVKITVVEQTPVAAVALVAAAPKAAGSPAPPTAPSTAPSTASAAAASTTPSTDPVPTLSTSAPSPSPAPSSAPKAGWALVDRSGRVLTDVTAPPPGLVKLEGGGHPDRRGAGWRRPPRPVWPWPPPFPGRSRPR